MPSFRASDYEGADLPEDTPLLCVIRSVAEVPNRFAGTKNEQGREAPATQLEVNFEITEGEFKGEKIRSWMNPTLGPKANLTKLACAAFGVEYTKEMEVDTDALVGKSVYVIGDYGEDGKSSFLKPRKYKPAEGGARRGRPKASETEATQDKTEKAEPVAAGKTAADDLDF